ncbi:S8 family serine peptidase [Dyadobacter sp. CY347]|uniref:S8 family serine peptidase n=1 Tax=Dyadobacter sp. CY347 TaxID=2909336 RepID=UPI001F278271|nr:S8 family serine peptidase [Dyadobacter sp. CY347]MCF2487340.1 S8 family peptidase [Dyadobacter sp. CY347]
MCSRKLCWLHLTFVMVLLNSIVYAQNGSNPKLHLRNGTIVPPANLSETLTSASFRKSSPTRRVVIIQFNNIPDKQAVDRLNKAGIDLLDYVPENAYTAMVSGTLDANVLLLADARSVVELTAADKIHPDLLRANPPAHAVTVAGKIDVVINFPSAISGEDVEQELESNNIEVISNSRRRYHIIEARIEINRLDELASLPWLLYIEAVPPPAEPLNDKSVAGSRANVLASGLPSGYRLDGEGVVIGIVDSGDIKSHIDLSPRAVGYIAYPNNAWHGLHMAGTAAGGGIVNEMYKGYAPKASILLQSNLLYQASTMVKNFGMVVAAFAYGSGNCDSFGYYDYISSIVDKQADELPHLTQVFAAGNSGLAGSCNGLPAGFGTVLDSYMSSKNGISVGNMTTTGLVSTASSKGPLKDGRIKPDLIAAGTTIVSTMPNNLYRAASGTSMAAPAVAGGIALLTQRYRQLHNQQNPKNSLVKALLCNGATDRGLAGPDYSYGFGAMNLLRSVTMLEKGQYFNGSLANQASGEHQIQIPANTTALKVMLYWNDRPMSMIAEGKALVNNLDLSAKGPGGQVLLPLILDPTAPQLAAVAGVDTINNVEQIVVENPGSGTYTFSVAGTQIPSGPQDYYLVYDIIEKSIVLTHPIGDEHFTRGDAIDISWDSYGNPASTYAISYSLNNGDSWTNINSVVTARSEQLRWTVPEASTGLAKIRIVQNETGVVKESGTFSIMGVPVISFSPIQCEGYAAVKWTAVNRATDYEVMRLEGNEMKPVAVTSGLNYILPGLSRDSTYYISVRARINGIAGRRAVGISRKPDNGSCAGDISNLDLAIDSIISPLMSGRMLTSSQLSASQPISVVIRNLDDQRISTPFQIGYSIGDSNAPVHWETVSSGVNALSHFEYTFQRTEDLHNAGTYAFHFFVKLDGDPVASNNQKSLTIKHLPNPVVALPYFEDYESLTEQTLMKNSIGLDNADIYDFATDQTGGMLKTFPPTADAYSGTKSLTLNTTEWAGYYYDAAVDGTYNLAGHDAREEEIRLAFSFRHHNSDSQYSDVRVYIRGKDTDPWILALQDPSEALFPIDKNHYLANINVSELLIKNDQQFSTSFQVSWRKSAVYPVNMASYSIDDIRLFKATSDVRLVQVAPLTSTVCSDNGYGEIRVVVRNNGSSDNYQVPLQIQVDNVTVFEGNIPLVRQGRDTLFTAYCYSNLHLAGDHTVKAFVYAHLDADTENDTIRIVKNTPAAIASFPYLEDFESGPGLWQAPDPNSAWQFGSPNSTKVNGAASGVNAWKTNLTEPSQEAGVSYLYSPCFDLRNMSSPMLSFSTSIDLATCNEDICNVAYVEYNTGNSWNRLDGYINSVNWYNTYKNFQAAWNYQDYTRWHVSTATMYPGQRYVRFRFVLETKASNGWEGFAIDDFHLYDGASRIHELGYGSGIVTSENVQGNAWVDLKYYDMSVASVNPNNQKLGHVTVNPYSSSYWVPSYYGQYYYLPRSFQISASRQSLPKPVSVRLYFTDSEAERLLAAPDKTGIEKPLSAYELAVTRYSGLLEDNSLENNTSDSWAFHSGPLVKIVPYQQGYYAEFQTKTLSEFWLSKGYLGIGTPFPVTIIDFSAKSQTGAENKESVLLEWQTASEENFSHFVVEVATDKDGLMREAFSNVGQVAGAGNSSIGPKRYSLTDHSPALSVTNYYRLKMVDMDGTFRYSTIRPVHFNRENQWKIYPNPARDHFAFEFEETKGETVDIHVYDLKGNTILKQKVTSRGQPQTEKIELSPKVFSSGNYLIKAASKTREKVFKMIKQ